MNALLKSILLPLAALPIFLTTVSGILDDLPERAPTDRAEYRKLVLENGLRVILLSDPDLNKSSASLAVDVGSLRDPNDRQGLAHFLEHMLFLGTEKFPSEAEYGNYIRSNGGRTNAYTSGDHTNYHFEVGHQAFEGALDRFAQFFIAPLFLEAFTEREVVAVNAEFQQNLENDFRRILQILTHFYNPEHPANHFGTGNIDTLGGITRDEFIEFYREYYTANQMGLALTGQASLDQLEQWTRRYFSAIPTTGRDALDYPTGMILPEEAVRWIRVEPVKDMRELQLVFGLEGTRHLWSGKSPRLIAELIGHEGPGSLLSYLKAKGLATSLGMGFWDSSKDYSRVFITIGLTPDGQARTSEVLESFYAYLDLLRQSEYPGYLFDELAAMGRLDQLYEDKGEGTNRSVFLANQALQYPEHLEQAEEIPYLFLKQDVESYYNILDELRPELALVVEVARGVATTESEPIYGSAYGFDRLEGEPFERLQSPERIAALSLPPDNPYVPTSLEMQDIHPVALIEEPGVTIYFLQDLSFERPQSSYHIRVRTPEALANVREAVLREFYMDVLSEVTNEEIYLASRGGASATMSGDLEGITFEVSGFNGSAEQLLRYLIRTLQDVEFSEIRFEALRERRLRELRNFSLSQAYIQARETQRKLAYNRHFTPAERLAEAESVTLEDVLEFARRWHDQGNLEMMIHGNLTPEEAARTAREVISGLDLTPLKDSEGFSISLVRPSVGEEVIHQSKIDANNSCFWQELVIGMDSPRHRAVAMFLNNFISEPYFSEMRTRQQLGYIVWSFTSRRIDDLVAGFVIQSPDYTAQELRDRSDAMVRELPALLREMSDEDFAAIVAGVESTLKEKDKSITARTDTLFRRAFTHEGDWNRNRNTLAALSEMTREDVVKTFEATIDPRTSRIFTVLAYSRDHAMDASEP